MRPVIGRDCYSRTFTPRTCQAAFGTPFEVKRRRRIDMDHVIGAMCAVGFVALVACLLMGVL